MNKFLVLYTMPISGLEAWMQKPIEERKPMEDALQQKWKEWSMAHAQTVKETAGAGKTKKVTTAGVEDTKNNVMLYSIVEASSHEEAAQMFVGHPHLTIPEASIEVMQINMLTGMQ